MKQSNSTPTEELTARFFRSIYKNDDKTYCVSLYTINKGTDTVTVVGNNLPEVPYNVTFSGRWTIDKTYGRQFRADMVIRQLPESRHDVIRFISSLKVGIGTKKAEKMLDLVGMDKFWDVLKNDPIQFCDVKGVRLDSVTELQKKVATQAIQAELFRMFGSDLKCDGRQYKKICAFFKSDAQQMLKSIKENPFILMKCGYEFEELDYYSCRHTGFPRNDYRRLLAAAQQVLIKARQESHVGLPAERMISGITEQLRKQGAVDRSEITNFLSGASSAADLIYSLDLFYLPRYYLEEVKIAETLCELVNKPTDKVDRQKFLKVIAEYEKQKGFQLSDDQEHAILTALERSVCIITGGPGTGKSTIMDALLYCWKEFHNDEWLLMAPTGKAAVRMTETTEQPATTIHSSLGLNVGNEDTEEMDLHVNPLYASLVDIDECSMIDQTVMASISMALSKDTNKIQHLILVGDPEQLPSVGPGNILADCIASGVIPVCCLSTIYRQGAGSPIITNSTKIREGDIQLDWSNPAFKGFHNGSDEENVVAACNFFIRCVKHYGVENVVILSPYHKATSISTNVLNERLQAVLNPSNGRNEVQAMGRTYRVNDRVMQLKNTETLSNGDVGTITDVIPYATDAEPCVIVQFENGIRQEYIREDLFQLEHAWATSVHKSQGSQWRVVLFLLPCRTTDFLRRNILYTGITRSQEYVAIFGPESTVQYCIQNNKINDRYTNLAKRLQAMCDTEKLRKAG